MEAGILAILGGQPILVTPEEASDNSDSPLLESNPFRNMMEHAAARLEEQGGNTTAVQKMGEFIDRVPTLLLHLDAEEYQVTRLTDPAVLVERAQNQVDQPDGLLAALVHQNPQTMLEQLKTLTQTPGDQAPDMALWSFSDARYALTAQVEEAAGDAATLRVVPVTSELPAESVRVVAGRADGEADLPTLPLVMMTQSDSTTVSSAPVDVPAASLAQWDALIEQAQWLSEQQEMLEQSNDMAVPLVVFTNMTPDNPIQPWLAQQQVQSIQVIAPVTQSAIPVSANVVDAIAQDDLAGLSDDELAELDALIERVTQGIERSQTQGVRQATHSIEGENGFRALVDQQLADKARSIAPEQATPTNVSTAETADVAQTSQPTSQTNPLAVTSNGLSQHHDFQARILQATPLPLNANATPTEQVQVTIAQAIRSGMDRIIIQLEPAELGRVDVRLDLNADGRTQMIIQADNRDTLEMLQRDARLLERALQDAGLDANAQDMEFNLNQHADRDDNENGTKDALNQAYEDTVEELRQPELTMDPLTGHYTLSIAQGLDIKV